MVLAPCLTGCTSTRDWVHHGFKVGPDYQGPCATVTEQWIEKGDPRLLDAGREDACWWTVFGDATLDRLVATASQQNVTLKAACFRIVEAQAERGVAAGYLLPQQQEVTGHSVRTAASLNAYPYSLFPMKQYFDDQQVGFNAAWELDFWGRFRRAVEMADANLDAQVAAYDEILVLLQAEVATNYLQLRAYQERLTLARKNVALQTETLRIIALREQKGLVTDLDVQQATTNLGATESLIPVLDAGHRRAEHRLSVLMGQPPQRLTEMLGPEGSIPVPPQEVVVGIPAELLRRRPDVRRAERQAAAQSARIGMAQAEFYPHIAITGSIGLEAEHASQLFDSASLVGAIGPAFRWNILNYGRIRNNVRAEDAKFQQALFSYQEVVLRANEEVENGMVNFLREQDRIRALEKSTHSAGRSVEIAMRQYENGMIFYQPLLDSERALVHQQDQLAESRGLVGIHLVGIYKALGGGWRARLGTLPLAGNASAPPTAPSLSPENKPDAHPEVQAEVRPGPG